MYIFITYIKKNQYIYFILKNINIKGLQIMIKN